MIADNLFSSVHVVEELWSNGLKYVGTLRANKKQLPAEFLPSTKREIESSLFVFNDFMSLSSYVPKKNRAVVLISSHHHSNSIDVENAKKPSMITFYNKNKSGVDTLGHLIESFTCRRKTMRWPYLLLMYILDVSSFNSYVLGIKISCKNMIIIIFLLYPAS